MDAVDNHRPPQREERRAVVKVIADASDQPKRTPGSGSADITSDTKSRSDAKSRSKSEIEEGLAPLKSGGHPDGVKLIQGIKDYIIGKFGADGTLRNYDFAKQATDELLAVSFPKSSSNSPDPARNAMVKAVNQYLQSCLIDAMINAKPGNQLTDAKMKAVVYVTSKRSANDMNAKDRMNGLLDIMNHMSQEKTGLDPKITAEVKEMCEQAILPPQGCHL